MHLKFSLYLCTSSGEFSFQHKLWNIYLTLFPRHPSFAIAIGHRHITVCWLTSSNATWRCSYKPSFLTVHIISNRLPIWISRKQVQIFVQTIFWGDLTRCHCNLHYETMIHSDTWWHDGIMMHKCAWMCSKVDFRRALEFGGHKRT